MAPLLETAQGTKRGLLADDAAQEVRFQVLPAGGVFDQRRKNRFGERVAAGCGPRSVGQFRAFRRREQEEPRGNGLADLAGDGFLLHRHGFLHGGGGFPLARQRGLHGLGRGRRRGDIRGHGANRQKRKEIQPGSTFHEFTLEILPRPADLT